ncbi:MAG: DUF2500 domain-containing protein [Oscillospiraceae bacterium]|jgi:hypothetical protein|nr:DUF2500 domain-containing protein [Oscillospiraceae bacterium]
MDPYPALGIFIIILFFVFIFMKQKITVLDRAEEHERVKVVSKRIEEGYEGGPDTHLITFKFPDGSEKEFDVSPGSLTKSFWSAGIEYKKFYDTFHEGDIGIITYKERNNIEKHIRREKWRWMGRYFISFEKDPAPPTQD